MSIGQQTLQLEELSLMQASKIAECDRATLWRHILRNNLRARQVGRTWIIRAADLQSFLADRVRNRYR